MRAAPLLRLLLCLSLCAAADCACPAFATVTTLAGGAGGVGTGFGDGVGTAATFRGPASVASDRLGTTLYIADYGNNLIRAVAVSSAAVSTLAGGGSSGIAAGRADGVGAAATFYSPAGVATDGGGAVYVADTANNLVRAIWAANASVTTLAGGGGAGGTAFGGADGAGSAATFYGPTGVAADASGRVFVADTYNNRVRRIVVAGGLGVVSTLAGGGDAGSADGVGSAATFFYPSGVAVDAAGGTVLVAEYPNNLVRAVVVATGAVTTVAGGNGSTDAGRVDGVGTAAMFFYPGGVAVDGAGGAFVADGKNFLIRAVALAGAAVTTLAGGGAAGGRAQGAANGVGSTSG
jgi:sugar lactone lactonase YvrE